MKLSRLIALCLAAAGGSLVMPSQADASCVFLRSERVTHNGMYYSVQNNCNYPVTVRVRIGTPNRSTYVGVLFVRGYQSNGHFSYHFQPRIESFCRTGSRNC